MTQTVDAPGVEAVVRGDAALLERDLAGFLRSLAGAVAPVRPGAAVSVYEAALRRSLYGPVADAVGSRVGQEALAPAAGPAGGGGGPLRPSMVFWAPLDAAVAALGVVEDERRALDDAMRGLGLASQLFNDLTDFVPELGGANTHEDFDGLGNRVVLELLGDKVPAESAGPGLKRFVLGHPKLQETLVGLAEEAAGLKRAAKEAVHGVCRSDRSAAYFDVTIERKGHLIDRLYRTVRGRSGG
ncbi:hypothetical protein [Streptomyces sp. NPDC090036]|uniref:hypothetical protein n=1 Tax=Streptomyces sp. NPDC090036 TaxID=3365926 RepID=UPI00381AAA1D